MTGHHISWQSLDLPGSGSASLKQVRTGWLIQGAASLELDGREWKLDYLVACTADWHTINATIKPYVDGERQRPTDIWVTGEKSWEIDGHERLDLQGLVDVDLGFTPATNTLPIRRLNLPIGEKADVTAVWLDFPSLAIVPLRQRYHRLGEYAYGYEAPDLGFETVIEVDEAGFVVSYPGLWRAIPRSTP